jgi:Uma2 family endonuclease
VGAKTAISVEEYLRRSFDGPDREYVDGEVVERAVGDNPHSAVQTQFIEIFAELRKRFPLYARVELRHRVQPTRYRIPDVTVFLGGGPSEDVPSAPPYITIEIISPDDRYTDLLQKLEEYRAWGVGHIWLVDPRLRKLAVYDGTGLHDVPAFALADFAVEITPAEIFAAL